MTVNENVDGTPSRFETRDAGVDPRLTLLAIAVALLLIVLSLAYFQWPREPAGPNPNWSVAPPDGYVAASLTTNQAVYLATVEAASLNDTSCRLNYAVTGFSLATGDVIWNSSPVAVDVGIYSCPDGNLATLSALPGSVVLSVIVNGPTPSSLDSVLLSVFDNSTGRLSAAATIPLNTTSPPTNGGGGGGAGNTPWTVQGSNLYLWYRNDHYPVVSPNDTVEDISLRTLAPIWGTTVVPSCGPVLCGAAPVLFVDQQAVCLVSGSGGSSSSLPGTSSTNASVECLSPSSGQVQFDEALTGIPDIDGGTLAGTNLSFVEGTPGDLVLRSVNAVSGIALDAEALPRLGGASPDSVGLVGGSGFIVAYVDDIEFGPLTPYSPSFPVAAISGAGRFVWQSNVTLSSSPYGVSYPFSLDSPAWISGGRILFNSAWSPGGGSAILNTTSGARVGGFSQVVFSNAGWLTPTWSPYSYHPVGASGSYFVITAHSRLCAVTI